jgi:hypothetical protein
MVRLEGRNDSGSALFRILRHLATACWIAVRAPAVSDCPRRRYPVLEPWRAGRNLIVLLDFPVDAKRTHGRPSSAARRTRRTAYQGPAALQRPRRTATGRSAGRQANARSCAARFRPASFLNCCSVIALPGRDHFRRRAGCGRRCWSMWPSGGRQVTACCGTHRIKEIATIWWVATARHILVHQQEVVSQRPLAVSTYSRAWMTATPQLRHSNVSTASPQAREVTLAKRIGRSHAGQRVDLYWFMIGNISAIRSEECEPDHTFRGACRSSHSPLLGSPRDLVRRLCNGPLPAAPQNYTDLATGQTRLCFSHCMIDFLPKGKHAMVWKSDGIWVVAYSVLATLFFLAWAYIPA